MPLKMSEEVIKGRKPQSDICNELRFLGNDGIGLEDGRWAKQIMREAADEIARLRSKIIILETERDAAASQSRA